MQQLLIKSPDTRGQDKMKPSTTILRNWFARGASPTLRRTTSVGEKVRELGGEAM